MNVLMSSGLMSALIHLSLQCQSHTHPPSSISPPQGTGDENFSISHHLKGTPAKKKLCFKRHIFLGRNGMGSRLSQMTYTPTHSYKNMRFQAK